MLNLSRKVLHKYQYMCHICQYQWVLYMGLRLAPAEGVRTEEEETHTSPPISLYSTKIQKWASTVYPVYDNSDSET